MNNSGSSGCQDGGVKTRCARDVTIWRIRVKVPKGANCLSFRFEFLSEEFPEFVGSEYNDAFIAELGVAKVSKAAAKGTTPAHPPLQQLQVGGGWQQLILSIR